MGNTYIGVLDRSLMHNGSINYGHLNYIMLALFFNYISPYMTGIKDVLYEKFSYYSIVIGFFVYS